jgi:predicted RNA-binding protein with TRAM domain
MLKLQVGEDFGIGCQKNTPSADGLATVAGFTVACADILWK